MHCGYITQIKNIRPHPNADRLVLGDCFGNTVCIGKDSFTEGEVGVYFPVDLQLSTEFCEANGLLAKYENGINVSGGYLDPNKRNIKAIKLRGEKSDGLFLPLSSLDNFGNVKSLKIGDKVDVFNGHLICQKYVPVTPAMRYNNGNKTRKKKTTIAPLFAEHADTEQLAYNLDAFKQGDEIEITLKMHGTSQRTGYLPVLKGYKDSCFCELRNALRLVYARLINKENEFEPEHDGAPIYDWDYVSGTRRVVLEDYKGGYYGDNFFREKHSNFFEGKLNKGETVYYEVVGFTTTGTPIMASCNNKKLNDKEFIKQYGEETVFSYSCEPSDDVVKTDGIDEDGNEWTTCYPQSDIYVYRMTMTNEDGFVVEYTPDFMRYRCEQMGVKTVPVFVKCDIPDAPSIFDEETDSFIDLTPGEWVKNIAEQFYDGPDPVGKTHIREGVVVRILNKPKFCAYKHKNFSFKVLEGIIKDTAEAPDMEEAQDCESV